MAAEDCSTVLEQFIHDVANLPAEITHLMEEIQAKDKIIQEHRTTINSRDSSLQKFIKLNGSLTPNPKEEQYSKAILQGLDKCRELQDEKIQLSEKACVLLDRQIKKLDIKIRDLIRDGVLSNDPPLPSLFDNKQQNGQPPKPFFPDNATAADAVSGAYTPLTATSGNANGAVAAAQRPIPNGPRSASMTQVSSSQTSVRASAPSTPSAAQPHLQQRQRESSAGAVDTKRRRLNTSLSTTGTAPSNLRQSSLGPGTPKASTPVSSSRAGSAGPRTGGGTSKKAVTKKVAPHQQVRKLKSGTVKRSSSVGGHVKKKSPSSVIGADDDDDESALSSADISESDSMSVSRRRRDESDEDFEEEDEAGEDSKVYCTCRSVSHGDMVACDNENCPYEWFHWKCVGLTREPVGSWYCDECRANLGK